MWRYYNPNPLHENVGDCVVRAICKALNMTWDDVFWDVCDTGFELKNMPSGNQVWNTYLRYRGFVRYRLPNTCPDCYTVRDFCIDHPRGTYILSLDGHVVCVRNGNYYDTWDSGSETVIYYWRRE